MQYKYATEQHDYSDFSSGRVFYSLPGHPAFPVRLASEIFQRCLAHRQTVYGTSTPCTLYDPCCGAAYHLSVLAYLHGEHIREVIGSDVDGIAVALAERNLGLLQKEGLDRRIEEISEMLERYGKESHRQALQSASLLKEKLTHALAARAFRANATDRREILEHLQTNTVDIVFTDIPYGRHSYWRYAESPDPLRAMLDVLREIVSPSSILAIASDRQQKVRHERYQQLEQVRAGKRRVVILTPI